jgi:hypothetical protein
MSLRLRPIRVHFNDGAIIPSEMTGTNREILLYWVGQYFAIGATNQLHYGVRVEFLDESPSRIDPSRLSDDVKGQIIGQLGLADKKKTEADKAIAELSFRDALDHYLQYEGICGYTDDIIRVMDQIREAAIYS